jgi:hypothetical protein
MKESPSIELREVYPPGVALWNLAGPDAGERFRAARALLTRAAGYGDTTDYYGSLRLVLESELDSLGPVRRCLWASLTSVFRVEPEMIGMEVMAIALAIEGEDGLSELIGFLESDDFIFRHKAAVGFSALGRTERWAVPLLMRALDRETQPLIVANIAAALGRIGGTDAVAALEALYAEQRASEHPEHLLVQQLEEALAYARIQ